jgi:AcrR family transcriptional regulator
MPYRTTARGERRRVAMRARLVDAAHRLFTTRGYGATSLREVVEEADTSIGNLYFYFPSKQALLEAVVERACLETGEAIDRAMAAWPEGPTRLAAAVATGIVRALADPALARLLFVEDPHARSRAQAFAHFMERTRCTFEDVPQLTGGRPPELIAYAWQGTIFEVIEALVTGAVQASPEEAGRFCAGWNLRALGLPAPVVEEALSELDRGISVNEN